MVQKTQCFGIKYNVSFSYPFIFFHSKSVFIFNLFHYFFSYYFPLKSLNVKKLLLNDIKTDSEIETTYLILMLIKSKIIEKKLHVFNSLSPSIYPIYFLIRENFYYYIINF